MKRAKRNTILLIVIFVILGGYLCFDGANKKELVEILIGALLLMLAGVRYVSVYQQIKDLEEEDLTLLEKTKDSQEEE